MRVKTLNPTPFYSCNECGRLAGLMLIQLGKGSLIEVCLCVGCWELLQDKVEGDNHEHISTTPTLLQEPQQAL